MKIRSRFLTKLVAWLAVLGLRLLFATTRVRQGRGSAEWTPYVRPRDDQRYLFCLWHDAIILALFCRKPILLSGLISRHQDGTYLAEAARILGLVPVRGSASRGGAQATRQLLDIVAERHICITPDGPRGPEHELKDGIVWIASRTGCAVVPCAIEVSRGWRFPGSWTDMILPKPFSTITLHTHEPIYVPADASREVVSEYAERLQREMDVLNSATADQSGVAPITRERKKAA